MNKPCHFLQCNKYYRGREKGWVKAPVLARWWQLTERTATVQSHLSAFFAPWNCWRLGKEMRGDSLLDPVWAGSAKQSEITGWKKWSLLIETRKSENWGLKKKDLEATSACSPSGLGVGEWGRRVESGFLPLLVWGCELTSGMFSAAGAELLCCHLASPG